MKYSKDPVVEEIRETRRKIFAEFGNDPYKFGKFLAKREATHKCGSARLKRAAEKVK